jgi:hypothetical protein
LYETESHLKISSIAADDIKSKGTRGPKGFEPRRRLAAALRWLAVGGMYQPVAANFGLADSTLLQFLEVVVQAINRRLAPQLITLPTSKEAVEETIHDFYVLSKGLPMCVGAIDGTVVSFRKPEGPFGYKYWSYKHRECSLLILGVVDACGRFTYVSPSNPGSQGDAGVFALSSLKKALEDKSLYGEELAHTFRLPSTSEERAISPYIVADSAFACTTYMLKPYKETSAMSRMERDFNKALCRARRVVECAFGRLKGRWRVLAGRVGTADPDFFAEVALACCVLHNYCEDDALSRRLKDALKLLEARGSTSNSQSARRGEGALHHDGKQARHFLARYLTETKYE